MRMAEHKNGWNKALERCISFATKTRHRFTALLDYFQFLMALHVFYAIERNFFTKVML